MVTTIQVDEKTILLLKKLKEQLEASSYDEAITKVAIRHMKPQKSMAGSLKRYTGALSKEDILKDLRDKNDRI
ncbi:hypothetical protein HYT23_02985 [Candidatus Pacearchaeota archaeon]|nr:hypothetical protein [Candidatus Pacearchaeota archaeon]